MPDPERTNTLLTDGAPAPSRLLDPSSDSQDSNRALQSCSSTRAEFRFLMSALVHGLPREMSTTCGHERGQTGPVTRGIRTPPGPSAYSEGSWCPKEDIGPLGWRCTRGDLISSRWTGGAHLPQKAHPLQNWYGRATLHMSPVCGADKRCR